MDNFARYIVLNGGGLYPLMVNSIFTGGTGLTNPSIYVHNNQILVNLRHVGYTLYHAEKQKFCHPWGPLQYLHPENDLTLRTNNYLCLLNNEYKIVRHSKVDTTNLDTKPLWEFIGLEDARIVDWNNKLYLSGVRRDTTTNGQGRMELSEVVQDIHGSYVEISRLRIPAPGKDDSYCEKNWMPILDLPYHYVKWCNPTEVVKVDITNKTCETVYLGNYVPNYYDFRGGSQVINWKNYRIALTHQVDLYNNYNGRKNAKYRHRFVVWDKDWNVVKYGEPFDFIGAEIEFSCGMCIYNQDLLITFGYQDNSAFLLRCPIDIIGDFLNV